MKIEGVDKTGKPWWIEADDDIEALECPQCGNPIAVLNASPGQQVQKIIFRKEGEVNMPPIKIGEFNLEVIREHLKNFPEPCPWCGYSGKTQQ